MSGTELLVIAFGLYIGYWVMSRFGTGKSDKQQPSNPPGVDPEEQYERTKREPDEQHRQQQTESIDPVFWYEVLSVAPTSSTQEIRHAYKTLISQYHPDKVASLGPELRELCERKTKEINVAYKRAMAERGTP